MQTHTEIIWRDTWREDSRVKGEVKIQITLPPAKECLRAREVGRDKEGSFPRCFRRDTALSSPGFGVSMLSHSVISNTAILRIVTRQTPLSMGFSRQECWSGLPIPPPGDLPNLGIEPASNVSPALQADYLSLNHLGSPIWRKQESKWLFL